MRSLISLGCLLMCLQACGGDTSAALVIQWGDCDFDRERWAHADRTGRGCMLASLFDKHPPGSMTAAEVTRLLGESTRHADYDEFPAYLVTPAVGANAPRREHLLVFVTDRQTGRVVETRLVPQP